MFMDASYERYDERVTVQDDLVKNISTLSWGGNVPVPDRHLRDSLRETEQKGSALKV